MRQPEETIELPDEQPVEQGLFRRARNWLFSKRHFRFKLLSGTAVGSLVICFLAGIFLYVTLRDHTQDKLRSRIIDVIRLSSLVENDIGALEAGHRGYLLTGNQSYVLSFQRRREDLQRRLTDLTDLISNNDDQVQRVKKVETIVNEWITNTALPEINPQPANNGAANNGATAAAPAAAVAAPVKTPAALGNTALTPAREALESLQDEEQIVLNQRMAGHEWAAQATQILDFLPKLERAVIEMEKEKRGYLLTGDPNFADAYKRAVTDFSTYNGYLSILVASNPSRAELLANIRAQVDRWLAASNPEMEAKRLGKDIPQTDSSGMEKLMANTRQMLTDFEAGALTDYEMRAAAVTRDRIIKTSALAALVIVAVALLAISNSYSFVLVRQQLAELEAVEVRIRSIIETILDGMITVDENGMIQSINPAAEKMFGYTMSDLHGYKFSKLVPKLMPNNEPEAKAANCTWGLMAQRTGTTTLGIARTRDQVTFSVEIGLSQMEVENRTLYVAMVRNVTEQKRFEKEIAAEKESLAVTLRSIGDGVITTDVNGNILILNNEAERLTGWTSAEAIGKPLKTVFKVAMDLAAQARAQRSGYRNEAQSLLLSLPETANLTSKNGTEYIIEEVASPIRNNNNEVAGVVLVFRDITERQRNEAERRKAETLEQLGLLAGGIAHDFNNLLTAIIGNISLASLLLPPDDELTTRLVDAKNASIRARDLAQQLLTFARGGAPIKKTASIGKLIQDTVSFSLRGSHSRSDFKFGQDLWPAEIDAGQISQVIANLAVNADQAMPNGGTLHVSCDNFTYNPETMEQIPDLVAGEYIRIKIRDEGVGIPEEYLKRIFDPYFTTKPKGTGLGLATTFSIVKNHNGLITVESELHHGTTFTLYLPATTNQEIEVENVAPVSAPPIRGDGRVLIVDDEESIRALVEFTLSHLGYEVSQAATALEGVNLYKEKMEAGQRFDLVILDLTLPGGMGGKEALKRMIEIDPTVNAIVSSGYATDATMSRYQDFGFRGVIAKPYEAAELGKTVHEVIAASRVNYAEQFDGGRLATRVA